MDARDSTFDDGRPKTPVFSSLNPFENVDVKRQRRHRDDVGLDNTNPLDFLDILDTDTLMLEPQEPRPRNELVSDGGKDTSNESHGFVFCKKNFRMRAFLISLVVFLYNFDVFNPFMTPYLIAHSNPDFVLTVIILLRLGGNAVSTLFAGSVTYYVGLRWVFRLQVLLLVASYVLMRFYPTISFLCLASVLRGIAWGGNVCLDNMGTSFFDVQSLTSVEHVINNANVVAGISASFASQLIYNHFQNSDSLILISMGSQVFAFVLSFFLFRYELPKTRIPQEEVEEPIEAVDQLKSESDIRKENAWKIMKRLNFRYPQLQSGMFAINGNEIEPKQKKKKRQGLWHSLFDFGIPEHWTGERGIYFAAVVYGVGISALIPLSETFVSNLWYAVNPTITKNGIVDTGSRVLVWLANTLALMSFRYYRKNSYYFLLFMLVICGFTNMAMCYFTSAPMLYALYLVFSPAKRICKYGFQKALTAGLDSKNGGAKYNVVLLGKFNFLGMLVAITIQALIYYVFIPRVGSTNAILWMYWIISYMYLSLSLFLFLFARAGSTTVVDFIESKLFDNLNIKRDEKNISLLTEKKYLDGFDVDYCEDHTYVILQMKQHIFGTPNSYLPDLEKKRRKILEAEEPLKARFADY